MCLHRFANPMFTFLHTGASGQITALSSTVKQLCFCLLKLLNHWAEEDAQAACVHIHSTSWQTQHGSCALVLLTSLLPSQGFVPVNKPSSTQSLSSPWKLTRPGLISKMHFLWCHLFYRQRRFNATYVAWPQQLATEPNRHWHC